MTARYEDNDILAVRPAYGNTDAERHDAALTICGILERDDAELVLDMLGLVAR